MRHEAEVNYAANPYGYPPDAARRGPRWSLWVSVAGVLIFAGGVLYLFGGGIGGAVSGGPPPTLEADPSPTKTRPTEGGLDEEVRPDRLVYERLAGVTRPSVERLLPAPEMPMPRPIVVPDVPAEPEAPVRPVLLSPPPAPAPQATTMTEAPSRGNADHDPGSASGPAQSAPAQSVVVAPPPVTAAVSKAPPPAAASAPKLPEPKASEPKLNADGAGKWRIQLASVRSEAEATSEWRRLAARHADVLGGVSMLLTKADLGDRGVYYRVQGAGVDEARARSICDRLKSQNVGCVVVRP